MSNAASRLHHKLKTSAGIIILGLVVEVVTLYWSNPTSFILFLGVGALLVGVGIAIYLTAIVK